MLFSEFLILLLFLAVIWYWLDGARTKEVASDAGRHTCQQAHVDFLDETVALLKVRLKRDRDGRIFINRLYQFEFSSDGSCRYKGYIDVLGKRILSSSLDVHRLPPGEF